MMVMLMMTAHREILGTCGVVGGKAYVATGSVSEINSETDSRVEPILAIGALVFGVPDTLRDLGTELMAIS